MKSHGALYLGKSPVLGLVFSCCYHEINNFLTRGLAFLLSLGLIRQMVLALLLSGD